jgi:hypothetical protein
MTRCSQKHIIRQLTWAVCTCTAGLCAGVYYFRPLSAAACMSWQTLDHTMQTVTVQGLSVLPDAVKIVHTVQCVPPEHCVN